MYPRSDLRRTASFTVFALATLGFVACKPTTSTSAKIAPEKLETAPGAGTSPASVPPLVSQAAPVSASRPLVVEFRKIVTGVPDEARVREIAQFLTPEPRGLGQPIRNRQAWAEFPNQKAIISLAERGQKEPSPQLTEELYMIYSTKGSRGEYEKPYQLRTKRLVDFIMAECLEDQGRFLPAIEGELAAILNDRTWTVPAHDPKLESFNGKPIVDLAAAMLAWNLGTADYLLGEKLQPETRANIRAEVDRRIFQSYRDRILGKPSGGGNWWVKADHNWNAVCHAGVVGAALALLQKPEERAWFLASMEIHIPNFLAGFTPDGYCSEGVGYWNYGFGHYVLMSEAVGEATDWKIDLFAPEIVQKILGFPRRLELLPGIYPAFSDNDPSVRPSKWIFQLAGARVPGSPSVGRAIVSGAAVHPLSAMLYETMAVAFAEIPPGAPLAEEISLPLRDSFPDAGVVISRSAHVAPGKGFAIAIKAGHNNEHHNHNDVGSYVLAMNAKTPLVDPGMENYTKETFGPRRYDSKVLSSYGHSVPVVAGHLQDTGAEARGKITVIEATDAADTYLLDLTQAYVKSVPSLKRLTRQLKFTRTPQPLIEFVDEVEFDSPQTFGEAFMTFGKCTVRSANILVISEGTEAVQVTLDTGNQAFTIKQEVLNEKLPSGRKVRRLGLALNEPVMKARIAYSMTPTAPPGGGHAVIEKPRAADRAPRLGEAMVVEADAFSAESGGKVETVEKFDATGGTAIRMWNDDGHELTWKFQTPVAGNYGVLLRYSSGSTGDALRALSVDGSPADGIQGGFAFPPTGGWSADRSDWKEVWLAQSNRAYVLTLGAGEHSLSLKNLEGGPVTLDWLALVPLEL